jgi:rhamnosyltransferase
MLIRYLLFDNNSGNKYDIEKTCKPFSKVEFIEVGFNSGVHALNIGISLALRSGAGFILLLDDDSYVKPRVIKRVLEIYEKLHDESLHSCVLSKVAAIKITEKIQKLGRFRGRLVILPPHLMAFSGTFIEADVLRDKEIKIREGFFLDQADFDFFYRLRKLGFITLIYVDELLEHKLGSLQLIGGKPRVYENSWRYYLIVRNSTILFLEKAMPPHSYFFQLIYYLYALCFVEGFRRALRSLIVGLAHGLFKKEGYLDPMYFKISPR